MEQAKKIIFYDGQCPLCFFSVKIIYKFDRRKIFYFQVLDQFENTLPKQTKPYETVVLYSNHQLFIKSRALIKIIEIIFFHSDRLRLQSRLFVVTDLIYEFIAKNRQVLTRKRVCPVLDKDFKSRHL